MAMKCNGGGDCDQCHNMNCEEWIECDDCGERIDGDYFAISGHDYCEECINNYRHTI